MSGLRASLPEKIGLCRWHLLSDVKQVPGVIEMRLYTHPTLDGEQWYGVATMAPVTYRAFLKQSEDVKAVFTQVQRDAVSDWLYAQSDTRKTVIVIDMTGNLLVDPFERADKLIMAGILALSRGQDPFPYLEAVAVQVKDLRARMDSIDDKYGLLMEALMGDDSAVPA